MAKTESDREDLMREATAYGRRVEFFLPAEDQPWFAGLRDDGALSVYCGADPVYHFDAEGRLRRAYVSGSLYRTQGETLARLERERSERETVLRRHDLSAEELREFLDQMQTVLQRLCDAGIVVQSEIPAEGNVLDAVARNAARIVEKRPGLAPPIKGKR